MVGGLLHDNNYERSNLAYTYDWENEEWDLVEDTLGLGRSFYPVVLSVSGPGLTC